MPVEPWPATGKGERSGQAFEDLPEFVGAELVEAVCSLLIAPFEKDPGCAPDALIRDEMNAAADELAAGSSLEQHLPVYSATGQITHMAANRSVGYGGLSLFHGFKMSLVQSSGSPRSAPAVALTVGPMGLILPPTMTHTLPPCPRCQATLTPGAGFCHLCGAQAQAPGARRDQTVWIVASVVVVVSLALTFRAIRGPEPALPDMASAVQGPTGPAPDISALSPRQRFDRLFDRVMVAAEQGDTATVLSFTDHAMFAYAQLDSLDADARYHMAILATQIGRYDAALSLADTILTTAPDHLFGFLIRGTVAEVIGDSALLREARDDFLSAWSRADASPRVEYEDHRPSLEDFRRSAEASRTTSEGS